MTVIHETPSTIATATLGTDYAGRAYVEVDYMPRTCSWLYVSRVYADGAEHIRVRIKSGRCALPANIKAAAIALLSA